MLPSLRDKLRASVWTFPKIPISFSPPLSTTKQRLQRLLLQQLLIADLLFAKTPFFSCHRPTQNSLGSPPTTPERDRFLSPFGQRIAFRSPLCWWRRWQVVAVRKKCLLSLLSGIGGIVALAPKRQRGRKKIFAAPSTLAK